MDHGPATQQSAESSTAPALPTRMAAAHRHGRTAKLRVPASWALLAVLAVQAALSLRLVRADTAFEDEATYLWAGHLEWAHVLHGTPLPQFPAYFSGAPVLYPPLGALADSVGGLTGARILSLIFMLGATVALWATTGRLFGRRAAFFAAALWAVSGPTLHLGAFATYDAMSMLLIALAAWLVVRAGDRQDATGWMIAAGAVLALANAVSYSSALFDPVVVLLALVIAFPQPGGRFAAWRPLTILAVAAVLLTPAVLIGGSRYLHGIDVTTLERAAGTDSPLSVFAHFWSWTGVIVVAAFCGAVISWVSRSGRAQSWLLTLLAGAALLVPAEQASLYTTASLNKHGAMGAWFAAIAAGYAVDKLIATSPAGNMRTVCRRGLRNRALLPRHARGQPVAGNVRRLAQHVRLHFHIRPASGSRYRARAGRGPVYRGVLPAGRQSLDAMVKHAEHRPAVGGPDRRPERYGGDRRTRERGHLSPCTSRQGYFSLIALNFTDTTSLDQSLAADIHRNHHYHLIQVVPYGMEIPPIGQGSYEIWQYRP